MTLITTIATIITTIIALAAFVAGICQYRRSVNIKIFRTYADKYNEIITAEKYDKWQAALAGEKDDWAELTPTMIEYLNLIWEEFFLHKIGIMPWNLWRLWLPEIKSVLATEFAKETIDKYEFHFPNDLTGQS
jgi:hypothetical protein